MKASRGSIWLRSLTLRTLAGFGIALIAGLGFGVIAVEVRTGAVNRLDVATELAVHRLDSPAMDVVMKAATLIGSSAVLLPVLGAVVVLALRRRMRTAAIILALDAIVVVGLYSLLKIMFSRERPTLFEKISLPTDYSFPSGHSMAAVGIYGVIAAVLIAVYPRAKAPMIVATTLLSAAIGFSRVYLGVHWPFDVLGGLLGGIPPLVVSVHLLRRDQRREPDRNLADVMGTEERATPTDSARAD